MGRYMWIRNRRYYYYETYNTWDEAYKTAKYYQKKNGSKYFIQKIEGGWLSPYSYKYKLYMSKVFTLGILR